MLCRLGPLQIWSMKLNDPDNLVTAKFLFNPLVLMRFLTDYRRIWADGPLALALTFQIWTSLSE